MVVGLLVSYDMGKVVKVGKAVFDFQRSTQIYYSKCLVDIDKVVARVHSEYFKDAVPTA